VRFSLIGHIMRTNIDIDDALMEQALRAGPFKTKKDAVEAGLKLLARQAAYREILKWRGKLKWEGDEGIDWTAPDAQASAARRDAQAPYPSPAPAGPLMVREPAKKAGRARR
jgi:antitoxin ParD1/3/4